MGYDVSTGAAWAVLFSVLVLFTILAIGSTDKFSCLPDGSFARNLCLLNKHGEETKTADYYLAARNSAGYWAIALSYFASGMGAWVVYGTTEMGATPQLSWLGVLGYSSASAFPAVLVCWLGPKIRERSEDAFSTSDFGRERYGRIMQLSIACISIFYMFIFIVAELTSIANVYALIADDYSNAFAIGVSVVIGVFTLFYTGFAGLPASIVTDKFQGIIMAFLVVILTIAVCSFSENRVTKEEFALASNWTTDGLMAAITLIVAISSAELFNQATWQRVWAAEDIPSLRKGFLLGSVLVFLLMMFFGVMGMLAYANDPEAYDSFEKFAFLAFFDLLAPLKNGWHILVLIMVTALAASSIDSLQNGLTSIFSHDLVKIGWNPWLVTRVLVVAVNIPAIWLASKKFSVLELFLVADLVCATAVFPTFLGLQETDKLNGWLPAPTEVGAFGGIISGIIAVLVNGAINSVDGGLWSYFWLRNGDICALCGPKTMVSFLVTPAVSAFMTYFISYVDIAVRGERARQPLIPVAFDKDDSTERGDAEEGVASPNKILDEEVGVDGEELDKGSSEEVVDIASEEEDA